MRRPGPCGLAALIVTQACPSLSAGPCVRFLSPFRRLGPGDRVACSDSGSKAQVQLVGARRPRPNSITRPGRALGGLRHSSSSPIRWWRLPQRRVQATKSFLAESRLPSITRASGACLPGGSAHHSSVRGPAARPGGLAAPACPISSVRLQVNPPPPPLCIEPCPRDCSRQRQAR